MKSNWKTEEDAKELYCCGSRSNFDKCQGSRCMAWVWLEIPCGLGTDCPDHTVDCNICPEIKCTDKGKCGLVTRV